MSELEVYEDASVGVRFYFTHSSKEFTTGVMILQPKAKLPKHNRPHAVENLVQVSGKCVMKLFEDETYIAKELSLGDYLQIPKGQYHIHSNPFNEVSVTLFKAAGDIIEIMSQIRRMFQRIELSPLK